MNALRIIKTDLAAILPLRSLFLQENNFQVRYNAIHERDRSDSYLVLYNDEPIGYGSVKGYNEASDRDSVFEFYLLLHHRNILLPAFSELLKISGATWIESQTNDLLTTACVLQFCKDINADVVLLGESFTSTLVAGGAVFRKRNENDIVFEHKSEPIGDYVLGLNNEVIATGGFLLHYNKPFADLYMEVNEEYRRKGYGSFLIQELKKQCYLAGRIPAARTATDNLASRAALLKAGMRVAGYMIAGKVKGI